MRSWSVYGPSEAMESKWRKWSLDVQEKGKEYERKELEWAVCEYERAARMKYKEEHGIHVFNDPDAYSCDRYDDYDYETHAIENGEMEPRHSKFYVGFGGR